MKIHQKSKSLGYTLVEIMVVVAVIALLATIAIPSFIQARGRSLATACINNLHKLDDSANQWALEAGKKNGDPIDFKVDLLPYIKLNTTGQIPQCPANGTYTLDAVGSEPVCSLSAATPAHILQ